MGTLDDMNRSAEIFERQSQRDRGKKALREKIEADYRLRVADRALAAENINRIRAKHGRA